MTPATLRFPVLFLVALAFGSLALATRAHAENGMEWQFSEANDPSNQAHPSARLIYGVPETDNVQVSGICDGGAGSAAKSSSVTFGADIGDLQNGKDTELRVSGGGFDYALKGQIFRATGEEGLSGVRVDVENDNPLWQAFAEKDLVDYLVPGYKASSLDLTKGRDKIQQFVKACAAYAAASAPAESAGGGGDAEKEAFDSAKELGTVEAWQAFIANYPSGFRADLAQAYIKKLGSSEPADMSATPNVSASKFVPDPPCRNRGNLSSQISTEATKLTFLNRSGATRNIVWLDFDSKAKSYGHLKNGEQIELDTFLTHPWMVTDSAGACLQIVMPASGGRVVELEGTGSQPAKAPVAKKVTGCEEGFKLVKGKCKRITANQPSQGCPAGTKPVPETDNCVPITSSSKSGCAKGQISVVGKCMTKNQAVGFCGPGFHAQGGKCVAGFVLPQGPRPSTHGCPPGMAWSKEEGCHEDD